MSTNLNIRLTLPVSLLLLMGVQLACVAFFLGDLIADFSQEGGSLTGHLNIEFVATLGLVAGIIFEAYFLLGLLRRKAHLERNLRQASIAMHEVIAAHFDSWKLSPSETDVANFLVKGFEISDIARLRGSAEGTVKAHLNAIYRKSNTRNRGELLSVLIESLMLGDALENEV